MQKILKKLKKHWTLVWLIASILAAFGVYAGYSAYTEVSTVKRVVSTTAKPGQLFSSNCMRSQSSMRRMTSTGYTVTVCNFDQEKPSIANSTEIQYILHAELQVKYGEDFITLPALKAALLEEYDNDTEEAETAFAEYTANASDYSIRKVSDDTGVTVNDTEHGFTADSYSYAFAIDRLAANKAATDKYTVTIPESDTQRSDPDFYVHVWAEPQQPPALGIIETILYGAAGAETSTLWKGEFVESDCDTVDYDFYNYVLTGNGSGTIDIMWDPDKFELNRFFYSAAAGNFEGGSTPTAVTVGNNADKSVCCADRHYRGV